MRTLNFCGILVFDEQFVIDFITHIRIQLILKDSEILKQDTKSLSKFN